MFSPGSFHLHLSSSAVGLQQEGRRCTAKHGFILSFALRDFKKLSTWKVEFGKSHSSSYFTAVLLKDSALTNFLGMQSKMLP